MIAPVPFKALISRRSFGLAPDPQGTDNDRAGLRCGDGSGRYPATSGRIRGSARGSGFSPLKSTACAIRYRATSPRARYTCVCACARAHALRSLSLSGSKVADRVKPLAGNGKTRYLTRYLAATPATLKGSGPAAIMGKPLKSFEKGEI